MGIIKDDSEMQSERNDAVKQSLHGLKINKTFHTLNNTTFNSIAKSQITQKHFALYKTKTLSYEELTYSSEDYTPIGEMRQAIEFVLMAAHESADKSRKSFFQSEECHSKHFYLLDNHIRNTSHITIDQDVSRSLYLENNEKLESTKLTS